MPEYRFIGVRVTKQVKEALEVKAKASDRSVSAEVRVAVKKHLHPYRRPFCPECGAVAKLGDDYCIPCGHVFQEADYA